MEERDKNLKDTYHINFLDRPLNNQEEPYEWQLENPEFIQQPPNEEDETESILENEYNSPQRPYFGQIAQQTLTFPTGGSSTLNKINKRKISSLRMYQYHPLNVSLVSFFYYFTFISEGSDFLP
ncbi:hypothetical protein O181_112252 [Austropuccinia psidii MF-1]|uniref:Uncharacterized protein n=1 Tax=Austropuccinia psidii MF-1 TaxID=1389203 RepID=A0A9Q3K3C7_9BASI|nr:hypothetical protein [Austropuccinia psidii MF-1]